MHCVLLSQLLARAHVGECDQKEDNSQSDIDKVLHHVSFWFATNKTLLVEVVTNLEQKEMIST